MSIRKGAATFRVATLSKVIDSSYEEVLKEFCYLPEDKENEVCDLTKGGSLLGKFDKDKLSLIYGSSLFFCTRSRQYVLNSVVVKEYFNFLMDKITEELGYAPKGKRKKEIKEMAEDLAKDQMLLKIKGTRIICPLNSKIMFIETSSMSKIYEIIDFLKINVFKDMEIELVDPDTLLAKVSKNEYESILIKNKLNANGVGADFLTYLFALSESDQSLSESKVSIVGDLSFRCDDGLVNGPTITKLSLGLPCCGLESNASLEEGKKVCSALFRITKDEEVYEVFVDETFAFSKFKRVLSEEEEKEKATMPPEDSFSDKILDIRSFMNNLIKLFTTFCNMPNKNEYIDNWINFRQTDLVVNVFDDDQK